MNLGHTFGHAVELLSNYQISHGQAVAFGLVKALELSDFSDLANVKQLLGFFGLETDWPKGITGAKVVKAMMTDKKVKGQKIILVLLPELGQPEIKENFSIDKIIKAIDENQS